MAPKLLPGFGKLKAMVRRKQQERRNGKDSKDSKRNKPPMPTIDVPTVAMRGNSLATVCSSGYFDTNGSSYRSIVHEPSLRGEILLPAVPLPSPTPQTSTTATTSSGSSGRRVPSHAPKPFMHTRAHPRSMRRTPTPPPRNRTNAADAASKMAALTVEDAASITSSTTWTDSITMTSSSPALASPTISSSPTTNAMTSSNSAFRTTIMASSPPPPPLLGNHHGSASHRRVHPTSGLSLEHTRLNHKSLSFRLRKRNRAMSNKDFDDLLKMESHGWTLDPSLANTRTHGSRHNDRCKNRALGQIDFDRFIFSTATSGGRGGLRKTNSVGDGTASTTSSVGSATLAWPKPLMTAQFLRANNQASLFVRSKSAPVVVVRQNHGTAEQYPSDAELDRLESIHPFYRHDEDGDCHSPSIQSSRQDGDDALLGSAL